MAERAGDPSGARTQLLFRVLLWEQSEYVKPLARFLGAAHRPFRLPSDLDLPASVLSLVAGRQGRFIELFIVPIDSERVSEVLKAKPAACGVEVSLELSNLPVLVCVRIGKPGNASLPHEEFLPVLALLPRSGVRRAAKRRYGRRTRREVISRLADEANRPAPGST